MNKYLNFLQEIYDYNSNFSNSQLSKDVSKESTAIQILEPIGKTSWYLFIFHTKVDLVYMDTTQLDLIKLDNLSLAAKQLDEYFNGDIYAYTALVTNAYRLHKIYKIDSLEAEVDDKDKCGYFLSAIYKELAFNDYRKSEAYAEFVSKVEATYRSEQKVIALKRATSSIVVLSMLFAIMMLVAFKPEFFTVEQIGFVKIVLMASLFLAVPLCLYELSEMKPYFYNESLHFEDLQISGQNKKYTPSKNKAIAAARFDFFKFYTYNHASRYFYNKLITIHNIPEVRYDLASYINKRSNYGRTKM